MEQLAWMNRLWEDTKALVEGCKTPAKGGVTLFTPDGVANYDALWLRDFAYMVEYAPDLLQAEDVKACIEFCLAGARRDGWMPDRVYADGTAIYAAGVAEAPVGKANLDNTPFLTYSAHEYLTHFAKEETEAGALWAAWRAPLCKGLSIIPLDKNGLVYNDPADPHSPYGFTDTICKTGALYMESLLLWRAWRMVQALDARFGGGDGDNTPAQQAGAIEAALDVLFDEAAGVYRAATGDCAQIDIWGNMYMLYIGYPCPQAHRQSVLAYLRDTHNGYLYAGQVRHLPAGEHWHKLLIDIAPETYQNGAYWATATGWAIWCLAQTDETLAAKHLADALQYCADEGYYECVNTGYTKLEQFVVSGTNLLGGARRTLQENPGLAAKVTATLSGYTGPV